MKRRDMPKRLPDRMNQTLIESVCVRVRVYEPVGKLVSE